jgi:hypothetical protein
MRGTAIVTARPIVEMKRAALNGTDERRCDADAVEMRLASPRSS